MQDSCITRQFITQDSDAVRSCTCHGLIDGMCNRHGAFQFSARDTDGTTTLDATAAVTAVSQKIDTQIAEVKSTPNATSAKYERIHAESIHEIK